MPGAWRTHQAEAAAGTATHRARDGSAMLAAGRQQAGCDLTDPDNKPLRGMRVPPDSRHRSGEELLTAKQAAQAETDLGPQVSTRVSPEAKVWGRKGARLPTESSSGTQHRRRDAYKVCDPPSLCHFRGGAQAGAAAGAAQRAGPRRREREGKTGKAEL